MDDKTKTIVLTMATGLVKKALIVGGTALASHGIATGALTAVDYAGAAAAIVAAGWSFWNDYGKAIVLSQFELLKAKALAQADAMKRRGLPAVTPGQIASQSDTLTTAQVVKVAATLPPEIQANIAPASGL